MLNVGAEILTKDLFDSEESPEERAVKLNQMLRELSQSIDQSMNPDFWVVPEGRIQWDEQFGHKHTGRGGAGAEIEVVEPVSDEITIDSDTSVGWRIIDSVNNYDAIHVLGPSLGYGTVFRIGYLSAGTPTESIAFNANGDIVTIGDLTAADLALSGTLTVDIINEFTGAAGVTVEGVLLKDLNVTAGNYNALGDITAVGKVFTVDADFDITQDDVDGNRRTVKSDNVTLAEWSDEFGETLDTGHWTEGAMVTTADEDGTVVESGNKVRIEGTGDGSGNQKIIETDLTFNDCTAEADFSNYDNIINNGAGLRIYVDDTHWVQIQRTKSITTERIIVQWNIGAGGINGNSFNTAVTSFKFKIVRATNLFTLYYDVGGGFVLLDTQTLAIGANATLKVGVTNTIHAATDLGHDLNYFRVTGSGVYWGTSPTVRLVESGQAHSADAGVGLTINGDSFAASETTPSGTSIKYRGNADDNGTWPASGWSVWKTAAEMNTAVSSGDFDGFRYIYIEAQLNSDSTDTPTLSDATLNYMTGGAGTYSVAGTVVVDGDRIIYTSDGSAALPSHTFSSDVTKGMYNKTTNTLGWSVNAIEKMVLGAAALQVDVIKELAADVGVTVESVVLIDGLVRTLVGTEVAPAFSFDVDISVGMWLSGGGDLSWSIAGTEELKLDVNSLYVDVITELQNAAGVTIETILLKDGNITMGTGKTVGQSVGPLLTFNDASSVLSLEGAIFRIIGNDLVLPKTAGKGIKVDTTAPTFGFRDLLGDVVAKNTGGTKPTLTAYRGAVQEYQFAVNDEEFFKYHIPHDYVAGTDIFLHVHWSHNRAENGTSVTGGSIDFDYDATYSKSHNQSAFPAPVSGIITGTASITQYQQILSEITLSSSEPGGSQIDSDDLEPDGVIILTFGVNANNITVAGGAVPDPFIHYVDIHYQSTGIGTKQKAPDFYV